MSSHTPGPWEVFKSGTFWGVDAGRKSIIVWGDSDEEMGVQGTTVEQAHANALLIAAAPEMLVALKMVLQHGRIDDSESRMAHVASVITKAEGK